MQYILLSSLVLASLATADIGNGALEGISAYGYHKNIGIPAAERIRKAEEELVSSRIPGVVPAGLGQYPFKAGIIGDIVGLNAVSVCGGALVSMSRVLTAAHCWNDGQHQARRFIVVLGSTMLFSGGTRVASSAVVTHPNWSPVRINNDIAIVIATIAVAPSNNIAPIALPTESQLNEDFVGEAAIAIGYGITRDGDSITTNQNVVANSVCSVAFPLIVQISNICTSGLGGVGACREDSGGPLVVNRNNSPILVGVSSFGSAGCQASMPSVFARVTSYMDFITRHLTPTPDSTLGVEWPEYHVKTKQFVEITNRLTIGNTLGDNTLEFWKSVYEYAGLEF